MYSSWSDLGVKEPENVDLYSVEELQSIPHKQQVLRDNIITCINHHADFCQPCRQTAPVYARLASTFNKQGFCAMVKEDYNKKLSPHIQALPTYEFFVAAKLQPNLTIVGADVDSVEKNMEALIRANQNRMQGQNQPQQQPITHPSYPNQQFYPVDQDTQFTPPNTGNGPSANRNSIRNYRAPPPTAESYGSQYESGNQKSSGPVYYQYK